MRNVYLVVLMPLILLVGESAKAEGNCPEGFFPIGGGSAGWEGCAPMGPVSDGEQSPEREEPQQKRWGAIATTDGSMGVAEDEESEEDAKRKALEQCEASSSGKACEVRVAYYNQCVAVAWGDGGSRTTRGPELKEAEAGAMKLCQRTTTNCDLYYSACSYADEVAQ